MGSMAETLVSCILNYQGRLLEEVWPSLPIHGKSSADNSLLPNEFTSSFLGGFVQLSL